MKKELQKIDLSFFGCGSVMAASSISDFCEWKEGAEGNWMWAFQAKEYFKIIELEARSCKNHWYEKEYKFDSFGQSYCGKIPYSDSVEETYRKIQDTLEWIGKIGIVKNGHLCSVTLREMMFPDDIRKATATFLFPKELFKKGALIFSWDDTSIFGRKEE